MSTAVSANQSESRERRVQDREGQSLPPVASTTPTLRARLEDAYQDHLPVEREEL
jgi:hypothetical protein